MNYAQILAEDRRLAILRLLIEANGSTNESVLKTGLMALGHHAGLTREAVRGDVRFLADRGLVREEWFEDKVLVAHIQRRGVEVAEGNVHVEGIKRPSIGE